MSELLYQCLTKATTAEGDQRSYGANWLVSRRGTLKVFTDKLECGDWRINYSEIEDAVIYSFRSFFLRIPGYILTVNTKARTYHFGLTGWGRFWNGELPFEVRREKGAIGLSWFSIAIRFIIVGYICRLLWQWFMAR